MPRIHASLPVLAALGASFLFGASTPFIKSFADATSPFLLAGLLYLGSGVGVGLMRVIRDRGWSSPHLAPGGWPWLLGAIAFGGIAGPLFLMLGLKATSAATASLLLNLESALTALLAWVVFRESFDRRIALGMLLIAAGAMVLSWPRELSVGDGWLGPAAVGAACLCWAIDNNLTRQISVSDPLFISALKGTAAGATNIGMGLWFGAQLPAVLSAIHVLVIGFLGYGISLVFFVYALRGLGASRTGAYFAMAPFIGSAIAVLLFREPLSVTLAVAGVLMMAGVYLHLTEHHEHGHVHEPLEHSHGHSHDEHHRHDHGTDGVAYHSHPHRHLPIRHSHPHYPDIHHRHGHNA